MGYLKFIVNTRSTDDRGNSIRTTINRIESDMAGTGMLETNLIMHALSVHGGKVIENHEFILDSGTLDNNILG